MHGALFTWWRILKVNRRNKMLREFTYLVLIFISALFVIKVITVGKKNKKVSTYTLSKKEKLIYFICLTLIISAYSIIIGSLAVNLIIAPKYTNLFLSFQYFWVGVLFSVFGLVILFVSILSLRSSFVIDIGLSQNNKLITRGIYKYIRHPLYLGYILLSCGFFLMVTKMFIVANILIILITCLGWYLYTVLEENFLVKCYKNYTEYKSITGRFLPKLKFKLR